MKYIIQLLALTLITSACELGGGSSGNSNSDNNDNNRNNEGLSSRHNLDNEQKITPQQLNEDFQVRKKQLAYIEVGTSFVQETKLSLNIESKVISGDCSSTLKKVHTVVKKDGFYVHMLEQYFPSNIQGTNPDLCKGEYKDEIVIKNMNEELDREDANKIEGLEVYRGDRNGQTRYSLVIPKKVIFNGEPQEPTISFILINPSETIFHINESAGMSLNIETLYRGVPVKITTSSVATINPQAKVDVNSLNLSLFETRYEDYSNQTSIADPIELNF